MFTGIISDIGTVTRIEKRGDTHLWVKTKYNLSDVAIGASIAHDGACLTVVSKDKDSFEVVASDETLAHTTLGSWKPGTRVNLERAMRLGDELGGHIVSGHVDAVATIENKQSSGDSTIYTISVPKELMRFIAPKGSVVLDGISLTVNDVKGNHFTINLIPHTQTATTLGAKQPGDKLNLEVDTIARYVARLMDTK